MSGLDSVGTLLADIANLLSEGCRILGFADKRHWGLDEHEQLRALEEVLDQARKDFQELSPLVHGSSHYEHDRRCMSESSYAEACQIKSLSADAARPLDESLEELRALRARFRDHNVALKDWARSGGPINPVWVRDTHLLGRDLHRAQCRAAGRIFNSDRESSRRCLGAYLVRRIQRREPTTLGGAAAEHDLRRTLLEEMQMCAAIGGFERFGDDDIVFICDFCDGHVLWEDLEEVPKPGTADLDMAPSPWTMSGSMGPASHSFIRAQGMNAAGEAQKKVLSAPFAVANHMAPPLGDWQAKFICPMCEETAQHPQDEDDEDEPYRPPDEFDDLAALHEHLDWLHAAVAPPLPALHVPQASSTRDCQIM